MTNNNKQKIAAGLRALNKNKLTQPDYFLRILVDAESLLPPQQILGIPVLCTGISVNYTPYGDSDCNYIPVWINGDDVNNYIFERGYDDG